MRVSSTFTKTTFSKQVKSSNSAGARKSVNPDIIFRSLLHNFLHFVTKVECNTEAEISLKASVMDKFESLSNSQQKEQIIELAQRLKQAGLNKNSSSLPFNQNISQEDRNLLSLLNLE